LAPFRGIIAGASVCFGLSQIEMAKVATLEN
jgi:hypothetical protein